MTNAVFYCSFKLQEGADESEFLAASERLNDEYISKQKGYVSWKQLNDGETWLDFLTFETMEDMKNFEENSANAGELAQKFYSYIDLNSCIVKYYSVKKSYKSR